MHCIKVHRKRLCAEDLNLEPGVRDSSPVRDKFDLNGLFKQQLRFWRDSFSIMHHFWQIEPARSGSRCPTGVGGLLILLIC